MEKFRNFKKILLRYKNILDKMYVLLVPEINDPWINVLPRKPLPEFLVSSILEAFPKIIAVENPCNFSFFGRTFQLMRNESLLALSRLEIFDFDRQKMGLSKTSSKIHECFVNTIIGQRDMIPVANRIFPRFPGEFNALELFTLPDYLIFCDNFLKFNNKPFEKSDESMNENPCNVVTVGSFRKTNEILLFNIDAVERY